MTEDLTEDNCQLRIECDCCYSDILFITEIEFALVNRCIHNAGYYKGTYTVANEHLILKFDQRVVKEIYNNETEEVKVGKRDLKIG